MSVARWRWLILRAFGGLVGYGFVAAFLALIGLQTYRWFRQGQWTHIGMGDGLHGVLVTCCVKDGDTGRLAALAHWIEAPVDWLGLHRVLEVMPASLALFVLSVVGNWLFIYGSDRLVRDDQDD